MITDVCILGERVSGTCFLSKLITSNTRLKLNNSFGHKHFFQNIENIKKGNTAHILFLFITRDIIEWLQSFMYRVNLTLESKSSLNTELHNLGLPNETTSKSYFLFIFSKSVERRLITPFDAE